MSKLTGMEGKIRVGNVCFSSGSFHAVIPMKLERAHPKNVNNLVPIIGVLSAFSKLSSTLQ